MNYEVVSAPAATIAEVLERPQFDGFVFAAAQERALVVEHAQTAHAAAVSARVATRKRQQLDLLQTETVHLLGQPNLVLPVLQPVAAQVAQSARLQLVTARKNYEECKVFNV